jgi:S1/P1 Nuclease
MASRLRWISRTTITAGVASVLFLCPPPAGAWNSRGHMLVAAVAWNKLSPDARAKAVALLQLNPDLAKLLKGVRPEDRDVGTFLRAATWPDGIKPVYVGKTNKPPHQPTDAQNIGYADCLQHRYWHFDDLPFSTDGTALHPAGEPNAVTQIQAFTAALADPQTSDDVKSYDLAWLLHLVGDVHQPLHATTRFTQDDPNGDGGGNGVQLCVQGKKCSARFNSLHGFWDDALGNSISVPSVLALACVDGSSGASHCLPEVSAEAAHVTYPAAWAQESFTLAKDVAYQPPIGPGKGPYYVTAAYRQNVGSTAEERIALAGARLAQLLEAALATGVTGTVTKPPLASATTCPRIK